MKKIKCKYYRKLKNNSDYFKCSRDRSIRKKCKYETSDLECKCAFLKLRLIDRLIDSLNNF